MKIAGPYIGSKLNIIQQLKTAAILPSLYIMQ